MPSLSHHSLPHVQFIGTKFVLHELNGAGGEISRYGHVAFIDFSSYFGNSPSSFGTLIGYLKLQPSIAVVLADAQIAPDDPHTVDVAFYEVDDFSGHVGLLLGTRKEPHVCAALMVHFIRFSIGNAEVIQIFFHRVLRCQTGVHQEALFVFPAGQAAIVVEPEFVRDDEGDDSIV